MKRLLSSLWAVAILGTIMSATTADADSTDERVLVVAVNKGHGSDARLVKGLSEHLQRSGTVIAEGALSPQDRACESSECIEELGKREGAQLVLTAKLQENTPNNFYITMALFDAVKRAPFQETAVCDECNPDALIGKLSDIADKLIKQCREARQAPVRPTHSPNVPTVPLLPPATLPNVNSTESGMPIHQGKNGHFANLSLTRKVVGGVLLGLGAVVLGTAIGLHATDDKFTLDPCMTARPDKGCVTDHRLGFGLGYGLTGALLISGSFTLFWPTGTAKPTNAGAR